MKKIVIYYFSGTGNTEFVIRRLCEHFTKLGCSCTIVAMEDILKHTAALDEMTYECTGFCYPVHAFDAPQIVYDFIARLPQQSVKQNAFILKCPGDPVFNAGSTAKIRCVLEKKGFIVFHESIAVMPANVFVQFKDTFKQALYSAVKRKTGIWAEEITNGKQRLQKNNVFLDSITTLFSAAEKRGGRQWGKKFKTSDRCTLCKTCVSICPTGNITAADKKIRFNGTCIFCLRCIYRCPTRAIITPALMKLFVLRDGYKHPQEIKDQTVDKKPVLLRGYYRHYRRYLENDL